MVGFWTFLFERLNKVLKSYNSSNHSGGELETSFFREFHRTILQSRLVRYLAFFLSLELTRFTKDVGRPSQQRRLDTHQHHGHGARSSRRPRDHPHSCSSSRRACH
jgi:hypothetical protein